MVLIGAGDLADEVEAGLDALGAEVHRLHEPDEAEVESALTDRRADRVAVVSRDDAFVLRMALLVRTSAPDVGMLVTIFDPTTAGQVAERVEHCDVTSMADIVAPSLAGPCLGEHLIAVHAEEEGRPVGLCEDGDGVREVEVEVPPRRRVRALLTALLRPYDKSGALLLFGAIGLVLALVLETVGAMLVLHEGLVDALYGSAKTLVTVDPNDKAVDGPPAFKVFLTVTMLCVLVFEASFTAGLVNRLIDRRLTGLVGGASCRGATTSSSSAWARSACGCARCCSAAASAWWPWRATRRAATSATPASSGSPWSSAGGSTRRCCAPSRSGARARSRP